MEPTLKIRQIEAFKAVVETGSVTAASRKLSLTQPAVSKLIAHLEGRVGMTLFERSRGRVKPTPEAQIFYEHVSQTFSILESLLVVAREIKTLKRGKLTVVCLPLLCNTWLPRQCVQFAQDKPDVSFSVQSQSSTRILEWVASGQVDLGIGMVGDDARVKADLLASVEAVCVIPKEHALAKKRIIKPQDFDRQSFVQTGGMDGTRDKIAAMFRTFDIHPKLRFDTIIGSTTCNFVAANGGVSLVNAVSAWEFQHMGYEIRRFEPELRFKIYLLSARHKPLTGLGAAFAEQLKNSARSELETLGQRIYSV
ncbi:MAG: LysR family transcriptional regulator [Proteobacteria bacterium]|nr:LysR family transcriptional regulator [Pseudomonadota bacterium]